MAGRYLAPRYFADRYFGGLGRPHVIEVPLGVSGPPLPAWRLKPLRIDAVAAGQTLVCRIEFLPGKFSCVSLLPGKAKGNAVTRNQHIEVKAIAIEGKAIGELFISEDELIILSEAA